MNHRFGCRQAEFHEIEVDVMNDTCNLCAVTLIPFQGIDEYLHAFR